MKKMIIEISEAFAVGTVIVLTAYVAIAILCLPLCVIKYLFF